MKNNYSIFKNTLICNSAKHTEVYLACLGNFCKILECRWSEVHNILYIQRNLQDKPTNELIIQNHLQPQTYAQDNLLQKNPV